MKKIIIAAMMLTGMLSARAEEAISEATYAIINIPISIGMNAIGISLLPMPGATTAVEDIVLPEGLTAAASGENRDKLHVFNGSTYDIYQLTDNTTTTNWVGNSESSITADPGDAMWLEAKAAGTIYQIGTVEDGATVTLSLVDGNNFIANPYPADLDVNLATIDWSGIATAEKFTLFDADLIRVWNGTDGYNTFYYVEAAGYPEATGWYNANEATKAAATDIPAGTGFWFYRRTAKGSATPVTIPTPFN